MSKADLEWCLDCVVLSDGRPPGPRIRIQKHMLARIERAIGQLDCKILPPTHGQKDATLDLSWPVLRSWIDVSGRSQDKSTDAARHYCLRHE
jgi:hypothetical protein